MSSKFDNLEVGEIDRFYALISKNVKKYRVEKNMSQMNLALEIGIKSVAFFSNAETNRYGKHFNIEHIYKISKALNIPFDDFFKQENI